MKILLLFCSLTIHVSIYSQSLLSDKKDVATNTRTLTSGTNPLHKARLTSTLQVQSQLDIQNDSIVSYKLNFFAPGLPKLTDTDESLTNACLLKDENGTVYNGVFTNESTNSQKTYTCTFSKDDFFKVITLKVSEINITTGDGKAGLLKVDKKLQDNIAQQGAKLLNKLKNQ